jgi:hypothetical protein
MNEFDDLENQLRSLSPGTLPDDVKLRLAQSPQAVDMKGFRIRHLVFAGSALAAAACELFMLRPSYVISPEPASVSIYHQESTLISAKPMGYVERDGRMWSLEEQQWQDEEIALCSNSPITLRSTRERVELVYEPVSFD